MAGKEAGEQDEPKKPKAAEFFAMDENDDFDDNLIPQDLVEEVWKETFPTEAEESDSDEPYEFVTESGHTITLYRKKRGKGDERVDDEEEEEGELEQIPSLPDVEGGIPKAVLKQMTIEDIEQAIAELETAMNFISAENLVFERTIGRMEQRDREIEAAMPIFTYKYPWELESDEESDSERGGSQDNNGDDQCDDDSSKDGSQTEKIDGEFAELEEEVEEEEEEEGAAEEENQALATFEDVAEEEILFEAESNMGRKGKKKKKKDKKKNPIIGPDGKIREICDWEDSEDEDFAGDYRPIVPAKEISVSKDKFFEGMPAVDRAAVRRYIKNFGELAPSNYDYMRHRYGKLINYTYKMDSKVATQQEQKDKDYDDEIMEKKIFDEPEGLGDEDPDFPGFFPRSAKRLPLEYKYKYAEEEDETLEKEITQARNKAYRKENSIQVLIDTNVDAFELLSNLNDEFTDILKRAHHPLTKRLMAEKILKFRKHIRNKILAEETKITMSLVELQKVRKKVNEQLKTQQEMGFKLQKIDFEQIRIRNNEYTNRIEKAHTELKGLKVLTAGCFQVLKEQRQKLQRKIRMHARMVDDIELRETLMTTFQADLQKYTQILNEVQARNNFMRKRIRAFKVPNSMEYIRFKAILYGLEEEVTVMRKRLRSMELSKVAHQANLESIAKGLPIESLQTLNDNDEWLEEIKREVEAKNLLCLLTEDEMNNVSGQALAIGKRDRRGRKDHKGSGVPDFKKERDNYDPEDDSKSATDVTKLQNNKQLKARQAFNRVYENKSTTMQTREAKDFADRLKASCGEKRYRRGVRGNIIVDKRDRTALSSLATC